MEMNKVSLANWGNFPTMDALLRSFRSLKEGQVILRDSDSLIARGLGRCYGDASLAPVVVSTVSFNKILDFNPSQQTITCQSGVTFQELVEFLVPKGLFLPVTPGTKYITVGGAVASDIHGKNHHVDGSFCQHVLGIEILLASGDVVNASPVIEPELFNATCGGMGLTGLILSVKFKLKKIEGGFIEQISVKAQNLDEIFELFEKYKESTYTVAWIDCLQTGKSVGRSILMVGEHARDPHGRSTFSSSKKIAVPFFFPNWVLNAMSIQLFNFAFYHKQARKEKKAMVSIDQFFYPLDFIGNWNKMYGRRGFVQYQCVLPIKNSKEGLRKILEEIGKNGKGSFLAVLKLFGDQHTGMISFPMKGYTLALDFPIQPGLFEFLDRLDKIVVEYEGRIYLTKDARMKKNIFWSTYPLAKEFEKVVQKFNPNRTWRSVQSDRLGILIP